MHNIRRIEQINLPVYDDVEVHPCVQIMPGNFSSYNQPSFEQCDENDPDIAVWSVYLHCVAGGIQCLADCGTPLEANILADLVLDNLDKFQTIPCNA